jgi:hypothetical protein
MHLKSNRLFFCFDRINLKNGGNHPFEGNNRSKTINIKIKATPRRGRKKEQTLVPETEIYFFIGGFQRELVSTVLVPMSHSKRTLSMPARLVLVK